MDRDEEVLKISKKHIKTKAKIRILEELELDLYNELEAQDQNMHPEVHNKLSEGYRMVKDLIRELRTHL